MHIIHKVNRNCAATFCTACGEIIELGMTTSVFCKKCKRLPIKEVQGDFILAVLSGHFDVAIQDCNCFCTAKTSIGQDMIKLFKTDTYELEQEEYRAVKEKLGEIEFKDTTIPVLDSHETSITIVNAYTQFSFVTELDFTLKPSINYEALVKCLIKINEEFKGFHVVMPEIGCGLSGGKWIVIKHLIKKHLKDCIVTVIRTVPTVKEDELEPLSEIYY